MPVLSVACALPPCAKGARLPPDLSLPKGRSILGVSKSLQVRNTHASEFCASIPKRHQVSKSRWGEFWTTEAPAAKLLMNFASPRGDFVTPPEAKFSQFRLTSTFQPAAVKRLARARWGENRRISPHQ